MGYSMSTAIKINNSKEIYISDVMIKGFKIGIVVSKGFIRL